MLLAAAQLSTAALQLFCCYSTAAAVLLFYSCCAAVLQLLYSFLQLSHNAGSCAATQQQSYSLSTAL